MTRSRKRFIAGAVCPGCGAMDRITVFSKDGKDFRECVECGFSDERRLQGIAVELTTRVEQVEPAPIKLIEDPDQ